MRPDEFFAAQWPALVPELSAALAKAGAPRDERVDLVQETALRLLGMWDRIDWDRPIGALAHRIALNAWRDQWRRRGDREVVGALPEQVAANDTERSALARVQVGEVARALADLPAATANVLRLAAEESEGAPAAPAAVRMARSRARRLLAQTLRIASAVAAVVVMGRRTLGRSARTSIASFGVLAAMGAVLGSGAWSGSSGAPARPVSPAAAFVVPTGAIPSSHARLQATHGVSAPAARTERKPAPERTPYYYVGTDTARAGVFVDVRVAGYEARVQQPAADEPVPVCVAGDIPSTAPAPRCTS